MVQKSSYYNWLKKIKCSYRIETIIQSDGEDTMYSSKRMSVLQTTMFSNVIEVRHFGATSREEH